MPRPQLGRRGRLAAVLVVVVVAVAGGAFGVVPVRSQAFRLEVRRVDAVVPLDDPWSPVWEGSARQQVPLSAQNIAPPFGGGSVPSLTARALHDDERIYLLVEWPDGDVDDAVHGHTAFSDAVALQFPAASAAGIPPYTMGDVDLPVNIWQWKAVWQADMERGFTTGAGRYPDTVVDEYPYPDDPEFTPARAVGNLLAQVEHASPVENLVAEGFGTSTSAEMQNVAGVGVWQTGRWRALFARDLTVDDQAMARFAVGEDTRVAFAVWDGDEGNRNGQKSIAQFIDVGLTTDPAVAPSDLPLEPDEGGAGVGSTWLFVGAVLVAVIVLATAAGWSVRPRREA